MNDFTHIIPAYIGSALGNLLPCSIDSLIVEQLMGGERHHLFKVTCNSDEIFAVAVRVNSVSSERDRLKSRREAHVLKFLDGDLAPRLYDFDESGRWFPEPVTSVSYVEGEPKVLNQMSADSIEELGRALARIHSVDTGELSLPQGVYPTAANASEYLIERLESSINSKIPQPDVELPAGVSEKFWLAYSKVCIAVINGLKDELFDSDERLSLVHGDVVGLNVIWRDHKPVLIDWEDTRLAEPAEEIAYTFTESKLDTSQRNTFWEGYSSQAEKDLGALKARVAVWEPVTAFGSAIWWLDRYARSLRVEAGGLDDGSAPKSREYYLNNALERLH